MKKLEQNGAMEAMGKQRGYGEMENLWKWVDKHWKCLGKAS